MTPVLTEQQAGDLLLQSMASRVLKDGRCPLAKAQASQPREIERVV